MKKYSAVILSLMFLVGCATISEQATYQLEKSVNCDTARSDIAILENEKASVGKKMVAGVRMIVPVSAVIGILRGDWINRKEVATGKYNQAIDDKIAEIKRRCAMN